jgi:hypothetical protein
VHREANRLFNQDRMIAWNTFRATFASWHDRAIAALFLLMALAVLRASLADRPWTVAAWAAVGGGAMIGSGAGRLVATRLSFHALDGLLAADALQPQMRRRYSEAWHGVGLALLTVATLIGHPSLLVASIPGYLIGVLIAELTGSFGTLRHIGGITRPGLSRPGEAASSPSWPFTQESQVGWQVSAALDWAWSTLLRNPIARSRAASPGRWSMTE